MGPAKRGIQAYILACALKHKKTVHLRQTQINSLSLDDTPRSTLRLHNGQTSMRQNTPRVV